MELSMCPIRISSQGRELTTFGSSLFPSACYEDRLRSDDLPWHWHDEWEVIRVVEGAADIKAGNNSYIIPEGSGIFLNSGVLHSIGNARKEISRLHSVIFHPRLIGGGQDTVYWQKYIHPFCQNTQIDSVYLEQEVGWQRELLDTLKIRLYEKCYPDQLSGGEQQRTAIARALINHPPVLFADEPTGNLDSKTERIVIDLLKNLAAKYGTSILIVTHNEDLVKDADRVIRLEDGEIVNG